MQSLSQLAGYFFLVAFLEICTFVTYDYIVRVSGPESKHFFKGPGHNVNIFMTLHLMWTVLISTNKTAEMVLQVTSKVCVYKFIDWTLFIALCAVSIFFMVDCLHKYTNKSTYFEVSTKKANSIEAPIITICFEPAYKKPALAKFNLEQFIEANRSWRMKRFSNCTREGNCQSQHWVNTMTALNIDCVTF